MKKNYLLSAGAVLTLLAIAVFPIVTFAQANNVIVSVLGKILTALQMILYAAAGVFVLIAAFTFLTAGGDPEKVSSARDKIVYALIAVVVAVIATGLVELAMSWAS